MLPVQALAQSGSNPDANWVPNPADFGVTPKVQQPVVIPPLPYCDPSHKPKRIPGTSKYDRDPTWFRVCGSGVKASAPQQTKATPAAKSQASPSARCGISDDADCRKKSEFVSQNAKRQPYCDIYVGGKTSLFDPVPDSGNRPQEAINLMKQGYWASGRCVAELSAEDGNADAIQAVALMRKGIWARDHRSKLKERSARRMRSRQTRKVRDSLGRWFAVG